jgi:hypothetical protein
MFDLPVPSRLRVSSMLDSLVLRLMLADLLIKCLT